MRKTRPLKDENRHLKQKVKQAEPVFFVLKKISLLLALFVLVFGELTGILLPMNDSPQTAQAATAVNVTASTEAQLDSYLSSTTTSYNIQITANITLTAGITVGNSQTIYGNGSAVLDTTSYAIATPAGAILTLGDNNSSDTLKMQSESGIMLAGSGNVTLNNYTTITTTSLGQLTNFNGATFVGNGGTITRSGTNATAVPSPLVCLQGGSFSLFGGTYTDNNTGTGSNALINLVQVATPIISGGTVSGNINNAVVFYGGTVTSITGGDFAGVSTGMSFNANGTGTAGTVVGTISGGTFGSLIGSETTPFSGFGFNVTDGATISDITGGVFTGQASGALDNSGTGSGTLIKQIDGGTFYGQTGSALQTNNATTLLEPSLVTPTQGTARFRGGASGNSILNNAANFTLPTGYSISSTSTTSGVTPTSLGSLGFYYLTPSSEAVTFNWQLSSSAKAIQGSALFTNQSTSKYLYGNGELQLWLKHFYFGELWSDWRHAKYLSDGSF